MISTLSVIMAFPISLWLSSIHLAEKQGNYLDIDAHTQAHTWKCDEPQWKTPPSLNQGIFDGELVASCELRTSDVGDYQKLATTISKNIETDAEQIHAGPINETVGGLAGVYYDAVIPINKDGMESVRFDIHVLGDGQNRFVLTSASKEITATGLAKLVQYIGSHTTVMRTESRDDAHRIVITAISRVKKPKLCSDKQFMTRSKSEMVKQLKDKEEPAINDIASFLSNSR